MEPARPYTFQYPTRAAQRADFVVHLIGLALAITGGIVIVTLGSAQGFVGGLATFIYAACFVAMLAFSLAYNFSAERRRDLLRRLDHAGIFLMIAGSYTPFTALALKGVWSWGMTTAIWSVAAVGVLGKLFAPALREGVWIAFYLAMGWMILLAIGPITTALPRGALVLLVGGGLIYSVGVIFHIKEELPFSRSIWHGHVVAGAAVHWAAVLLGAVLPAAAG